MGIFYFGFILFKVSNTAVPLTTTVNAKPEIFISPETAHAAARKPSAAPSAVAAGNKYEKIRKSVLTTGWESAILQ